MDNESQPENTEPGPNLHSSELAAQLRQFIKFDVPVNLLAVVLILAIYFIFARSNALLFAASMILLHAGLVRYAGLMVDRSELAKAQITLAVGHWIVCVGVVFLLPNTLAMMAIISLWPILFIGPNISIRETWLYSICGVVIVILMTVLGRLVDLFKFEQTYDASTLMDYGYILGLPIIVALTFLVFAHQGQRIRRALAAEIQANRELRANERELERKVEERTQQLAAARDDALAATHAKSAFLATMSHEIRTPLNGVLGMNALLLETKLDSHQYELASTVAASGNALLTVINDVLDYSKIEAGKLDLDVRPYSVRELVESTADMVAVAAAAKKLELAYLVEKDVPNAIIGDPDRLRQVLLNLLNNALKFTSVGEVFLSVHLDESDGKVCTLRFVIKDTGTGIPPDRLDSLFEEFTQLDTSTTRNFGGTGLGLAISRRLSQMMGGTVVAESEGVDGKGSSFIITIKGELTDAIDEPIPMALTERSVLVVDDNDTNRRILELQTQTWGLSPKLTASPGEAIEWLRSGARFDLALLDMQMPELDGVNLAQKLHTHDPNMPMLILSSLGTRIEQLPDGVRDMLSKPVRPSTLFDAIVTTLDNSSGHHRVVSVGDHATDTLDAEHNPLSILVADDNEVNRRLILYALNSLGYEATLVENGREAVDAVLQGSYDVVLMDMQMPVMDGLAAARSIRDDTTLEHRPRVIAMTANVMPEDRVRCAEAGMDGFIAKPIDIDQVAVELRRTHSSNAVTGSTSKASVAEEDSDKTEVIEPLQQVVSGEAQDGQNSMAESTAAIDLDGALEELTKTVGGDQGLVKDIVENFIQESSGFQEQTVTALSSQDLPLVERLAHSLKGNARLFGDHALADLAAELEEAGKQGDQTRAEKLIEPTEKARASLSHLLKGRFE